MLGKVIGAYLGEKIMQRSGRGGTGAVAGAGSAVAARRLSKPIAVLLAAGYGMKLLNDYRQRRQNRA